MGTGRPGHRYCLQHAASGKRTSPWLVDRESVAALTDGSSVSAPFTAPRGGGAEAALQWVCPPSRCCRRLSLSRPPRPQPSAQPLPVCGCSGWAAGELASLCLLPALLTAMSSCWPVPTHLPPSPSLGQPSSLPWSPISALAPCLPSSGLVLPCHPVALGAGREQGSRGEEHKPTSGPVAGGVPRSGTEVAVQRK